MINPLKEAARRVLERAGYQLERRMPNDFDDRLAETIRAVSPYTMTSPARLAALYDAVHHIVRYDVPGDVVECGVWKGGSMMVVARTLRELGRTERALHLFDTFAGMPEPSSDDVSINGSAALPRWRQRQRGSVNLWDYAPLQEVKAALATTGYPSERIHFVEGLVEDTVPSEAPERIAVLRLDTDWYESTRHELEHLWPRLQSGGVLIIDDYGHWKGARKAVDEYLTRLDVPVLLARIDYTGRIAVKP